MIRGDAPLRDRMDDVPLLADFFLHRYADKNGKPVAGFTRAAMDRLVDHGWPGNVRELENVAERAVVLTKGQVIDVEDLPDTLTGGGDGPGARAISVSIGTPLEEVERRLIFETLKYTKGDKRVASQLLGIATRTIYRRLESERAEGEAEGDA